jgi:hypothetical protein
MFAHRGWLVPVLLAAILAPLFALAGTAQAAPPTAVDPVPALIRAGVPAAVADRAVLPHAAASSTVITIAHPGRRFSFPGTQVDAVIDHDHGTITVVQRWLAGGPSQLSVGWVNLGNAKSGVTGLTEVVPVPGDIHYGNVYTDRAATLPTGNGTVALVVWGQIPSWTGLIPLAPEYFGILTPAGTFAQV